MPPFLLRSDSDNESEYSSPISIPSSLPPSNSSSPIGTPRSPPHSPTLSRSPPRIANEDLMEVESSEDDPSENDPPENDPAKDDPRSEETHDTTPTTFPSLRRDPFYHLSRRSHVMHTSRRFGESSTSSQIPSPTQEPTHYTVPLLTAHLTHHDNQIREVQQHLENLPERSEVETLRDYISALNDLNIETHQELNLMYALLTNAREEIVSLRLQREQSEQRATEMERRMAKMEQTMKEFFHI